MPLAEAGQRVVVNLSGLQVPGVEFGEGVTATGTITRVDTVRRQIEVKLDIAVGGQDTLGFPPEDVSAID